MKVNTPTLTAAETAFALRVNLGPLRAWTSFLSDNVRGKQDVNGHQLLPCCKRRDKRMFRPAYAVEDVNEFIASVLAAGSGASGVPIRAMTVNIDTAWPWQLNKFDQHGVPVVYPSSSGVGP
jgi:hypothetical protein